MLLPGRPYTPVAEIVAMAVTDEVADEEVDEVTDDRSTNTHTAKWTITSPKHAESESTVKAIQTTPAMTSRHATTAVSQDTSRLTASTLNVPGINTTKSTKAHHLHHLLGQEIATWSNKPKMQPHSPQRPHQLHGSLTVEHLTTCGITAPGSTQ